MENEPNKTFFSYCRKDAEFAQRLAEDLRAAGASVWLDQLDIAPGQRWDRAVEAALDQCKSVLVVLSPAAVDSTNVMDEVSAALEDGKVGHPDCVSGVSDPIAVATGTARGFSRKLRTGAGSAADHTGSSAAPFGL